MSEATGRFTPVERTIARTIPGGPWIAGLVVFAGFAGAYVAIAAATGADLVERGPVGVRIDDAAWMAGVLSALIGASFALSEAGARVIGDASEAMAELLEPDAKPTPAALAAGPPNTAAMRYRLAGAVGAAAGLALTLWIFLASGRSVEAYLASPGAWFILANPLALALGARAGVDMDREAAELHGLVKAHLRVDLARLDALEVYGRIGVRSALAWGLIGAILLLFLMRPGGSEPAMLAIGAVSAGAALLAAANAFAGAVRPVRDRMSAAKQEALTRARQRLVATGNGDSGAAGAELAGLAAYERWISERPEWPISAPVSRRLFTVGLIPVIAWFGAAGAELVVRTLAG